MRDAEADIAEALSNEGWLQCSTVLCTASVTAAEGWLPGFASALHRDAPAPVNLDADRPDSKRHLHRLQGDARLALRAVREAVLERNREGRTT